MNTMPSFIPVGAIMAFAGPVAGAEQSSGEFPGTNLEAQGWMVCDGRILRKSEYPQLYAVLGDLYNQRYESQDEFHIPDYRGYFLRGVDGGSGNDPDLNNRTLPNGRNDIGVGTLQPDALQEHEHTINPTPMMAGFFEHGSNSGLIAGSPGATSDPREQNNSNREVKQSTGENRPKNMSVYYIIKFK